MLQNDEPKDYVIGTNSAYSVADACRIAFAHAGLDWQDHVLSDAALLRPTEITVLSRRLFIGAKRAGLAATHLV